MVSLGRFTWKLVQYAVSSWQVLKAKERRSAVCPYSMKINDKLTIHESSQLAIDGKDVVILMNIIPAGGKSNGRGGKTCSLDCV